MKRIKNGGIELGIMEFVESQGIELSKKDKERKEYLDSLPKNTDIYLDENGRKIDQNTYVKELTKGLNVKNDHPTRN